MRPPRRRLALLLLLTISVVAGCRVMPGSSPGLAPSPTPAPTDPLAAFRERFAGDPPPYRVVLEVEIGGVSQGEALIEAYVDGADYRATTHVALRDLPARDSEIVFVEGTGYLREAGDDDWLVVPGYRSTPPLNPFLFLQPGDYSDEGPDAARGGLRRLSADEWVEADASLGYEDGGVRAVGFDVWVDERGVPIEADLDFELAGRDSSGQLVELTYSARYVFSEVGSDITIAPPAVPPTASP